VQINGVHGGTANIRFYCKLHALMACVCGMYVWSVCVSVCICVSYLSYLSVAPGRALTLHSVTEHIDRVLREGAWDNKADLHLVRGGLGIIIGRGVIAVGGIEGRKEREGMS
jgi:hypothetical protein